MANLLKADGADFLSVSLEDACRENMAHIRLVHMICVQQIMHLDIDI